MTGASFPQTFRTAIVPAAGLGTRFLPATKAVPKELLPVVDTPGIELVASEAAAAGAKRLVIVTSPGKEAVVKYFETQPELEQNLEAKGKTELLAKVRRGPGLLGSWPSIAPTLRQGRYFRICRTGRPVRGSQ